MSTLLPLTGDVDRAHYEDFLSVEEPEVRDALFDIHDHLLPTAHWKIMKATLLSSWCAYFGEHRDTPTRVRRATLIRLWLSKYVFGGG